MTRHARFLILGALCAATLWPADLFAQQRAVPRSRSRTVVVVSPRYYRPYYRSSFYYPGYYYGWYDPYFWGPGPYWQYPYRPYYGRYAYDNTGSARLQVTPRQAQVYVDGYFAGTVDDFDGTFQRLEVEAGEHEIQIYLEGYRPFTQKVLFVRGRTVKIGHDLLPLAPGEAPAQPPTPDESRRVRPYGATAERPRPGPGPVTVERQGRLPDRDAFGSLLLRVRPSDATITVDGEIWTAPQGEDHFVIELAEGPHRIEVRKDGFQTYSTTVRVRRGETVRLNVGLTVGGVSGEF